MADPKELESIVAALNCLATATPALLQSAIDKSLASEAKAKLVSALQRNSGVAVRKATVSRATKETSISVSVVLDGTGASQISTGLGFYDHMLSALSKHSSMDIQLTCTGDLHVDDHHTVEDCALALGQAVDIALGDRVGITRYGFAFAPLDEALARCVVDFSGRPSSDVNLDLRREKVGEVSCEMLQHSLQSFATAARLTLHVDVLKGANDHHRAECAFKALALALRQAISIDQRRPHEIASTKGSL